MGFGKRKLLELMGGGRESGEVKVESAEELSWGGFWRRVEVVCFELIENEEVDGVFGPRVLFDGWGFGALRGDEGPVGSPFGAFGDPLGEKFDLVG